MGRVMMVGHNEPLFVRLSEHHDLRSHELLYSESLVDALNRLHEQPWDVVVSDLDVSTRESIAFASEMAQLHPCIRIITLWPEATGQDVIAAMRAKVFACFTAPFDTAEVADMVRTALRATDWRHAIEVVSGLPHWLTLRVACHLINADRLTRFMSELETGMPEGERDLLVAAFRELLLNAMEHGAGFDPDKIIEVTAARTARAIVYHFKDPGQGFDVEDLKHAAHTHQPDDSVASAWERASMGMRPGGFGMLIARQVADELVYNERRNEVLMIKHLD